jgi:hypothetical protein
MGLNLAFPVDSRPANGNLKAPRSLKLDACLAKINAMIAPMAEDHDEAFAELVLTSDDYVEPLGKNEMLVLGSAVHGAATHFAKGNKDKPNFGYAEVQALTERFGGKPLGTGSIYGAVQQLIEKGLIERRPDVRSDRQGRPILNFGITPEGVAAFKIAVLAAQAIKEGRDKRAA